MSPATAAAVLPFPPRGRLGRLRKAVRFGGPVTPTVTPNGVKPHDLTDAHFADLEKSGLTRATILAAGFYSAPEAETRAILGFGVGPGLILPYRPWRDGLDEFFRVKIDNPGPDDKNKYRSPRGSGNRMYVPPILDKAILADSSKTLYVTEGEKKALKATQEGFPCIALAGVWSWRTRTKTPDGERSVPIHDLDAIAWKGRTVHIVFDFDPKPGTTEKVRAAEAALATELTKRGAQVFAIRLPAGPNGTKQGLDDYLVAEGVDAFKRLPMPSVAETDSTVAAEVVPLGLGLGDFLEKEFPPAQVYIEHLLSDDGGGWIGGEEKLGKTFYAMAEALSLATGTRLAGRFKVPECRRVLFMEEEDPPRRAHRRARALIRGLGFDPDDPAVRALLNRNFRIEVWSGFKLDDPVMVKRLDKTIEEFRPQVIYLDVFRKITLKDFRDQVAMSAVLEILDGLRRHYGVIFRVLHHFRKGQGVSRAGRGSQELSGSFVLGAWGENSLFFEPVGRKQGAVKVSVQCKDLPPAPDFGLRIEFEGPAHDPRLVRLVAEEINTKTDDSAAAEVVYQAIATGPKTEAVEGEAGVRRDHIMDAAKRSKPTVLKLVDLLIDQGRVRITGTMRRNERLYGVTAQDSRDLNRLTGSDETVGDSETVGTSGPSHASHPPVGGDADETIQSPEALPTSSTPRIDASEPLIEEVIQ